MLKIYTDQILTMMVLLCKRTQPNVNITVTNTTHVIKKNPAASTAEPNAEERAGTPAVPGT